MTNAAALSAHSDLAGFYARPAVRDRIVDFLGARHASSAVAGYGGGRWLRQPGDGAVSLSWDALATLFDEGADVLRSLGDREGTLLVLDLDYVHPADPAETVREPMRCFALLEPAHHAVLAAFARLGVEPLVLMTLAGYQYLARAPLAGRFHAGLLEEGGASDWATGAVGSADVRAHRGAGRLLQLVVHRALRDMARALPVPVRVADIAPAGGGPFIRLDLGAYADGAGLHHVRCAFSSDQTPLVTRPGAAVPFVVVLPRGDRGYRDLVPLRTDLAAAALYAESASSRIPDVVDGADGVGEYERSTLAAFHREMDHAPAAAEWAHRPVGLVDPESLPPCIGAVLRYPSPALLMPRHLRAVALALWSVGWHPRTIAALVRERYEEPHDWGTYWERHDRASRAEFFVRLFCAAAAEGLEDGGSFGCEALSHHGLCPSDGCGYDLGRLFRRLRVLQVRNESHA